MIPSSWDGRCIHCGGKTTNPWCDSCARAGRARSREALKRRQPPISIDMAAAVLVELLRHDQIS